MRVVLIVSFGYSDEGEEADLDPPGRLSFDVDGCPTEPAVGRSSSRLPWRCAWGTVHRSWSGAPTLAAVFREIPWSILRGYLMGAADIVPGVSGGTIALVLGIYERLIASVRAGSSALGSFVRLDFSAGAELAPQGGMGIHLPLGAGIGLAIISLSHLLENLLRDHAVLMASLFLGLVAGSALIVWRLLTVRDLRRIGIIVAVTVVVFVLLGLREDTSSESAAQITESGDLGLLPLRRRRHLRHDPAGDQRFVHPRDARDVRSGAVGCDIT